MTIYVRSPLYVGVTQPFLNILQGKPGIDQHTRAAIQHLFDVSLIRQTEQQINYMLSYR